MNYHLIYEYINGTQKRHAYVFKDLFYPAASYLNQLALLLLLPYTPPLLSSKRTQLYNIL